MVFCLILISLQAFATTNTEKFRSYGDRKEGLAGNVDGDLSWKAGNNKIFDLGIQSRVQYETLYSEGQTIPATRDLYMLILRLKTGQNRGVYYLNNGFAHLRWTHMWSARQGFEILAQSEFDEFRDLAQRSVVGANYRVQAILEPKSRLAFASGYIAEYESYNIEDPGTHPRRVLNHRWNNYASFKFQNDPGFLTLMQLFYFQPLFKDFSDFRILVETEVELTVTEQLATVLSLYVIHDSRPPKGLEKTDTTLEYSLRWKF